VRNKVSKIETTLLNFKRTKKFTTGWSIMAKITEKTNGTIMFFAMYIIARKAIRPTRKMVTFA
jgi:hypothetical protein